MGDFSDILSNQVLLVAIVACLLAQALKLVTGLAIDGKVSYRTLFSTGGMPSAHSALVAALATGVGQTMGWASTEFAIACLFAVIVMYDAAGVRQAVGKQAKVINQIVDEIFQEHKQLNEERLKELLGHTPFQVIVGLSLGIAIAILAGMTWGY